jgi:hypothetical protein
VSDPTPYPQPEPYRPQQPAAELKAPPGTDPSTPWIWLILLIPIVQTLPIFFLDWSAFVEATLMDPTGLSTFTLFASPAYVALIALGWIGTGLMIWFAYLDWRELQRRGVPQPFHWAWIFLTFVISYAVYTIGRSVVAHRRTGTGLSVMWVTIGTIVVGLIAGIWFAVVLTQMIFDAVLMMPLAP